MPQQPTKMTMTLTTSMINCKKPQAGRSSKKNRQVSEQDGTQLGKFSIWCLPCSCPYFCIHVKRGPYQQTLKGYRHWRWDVSANSLVFCTEITHHGAVWRPDFSEKAQTKVVRACHKIIWTGQDCPTGAGQGGRWRDRRNDRKTTSKGWLAMNGTSYRGKPRTMRSGGSWL